MAGGPTNRSALSTLLPLDTAPVAAGWRGLVGEWGLQSPDLLGYRKEAASRAMAEIGLAIAFVEARGGPVELARLRRLVSGEKAPEHAVAALLDGQCADGGWPAFWAPWASSLDATCFRVALAEQVGVGPGHPAIGRAVAFLAARQSPDGSWEEDVHGADGTADGAVEVPRWLRPGDEAATLYLTANCGFWLAVLLVPCEPPCTGPRVQPLREPLRAAGYLEARLGDDGRLGRSFLHTHWLAGGLWWRLGQIGLAELVFGYLQQRLGADFPASNLGWLVNSLLIAGVPSSHPLVDAAASQLEQCQQADGRWASEDGPDYDVHSTLEALRALRLCGRW